MATPVRLGISGSDLDVWSIDGAFLRRAVIRDVLLSEPFDFAPRMVQLPDGKTLQVTDSRGFSAALGGIGRPPALVAQLQRSWLAAIVGLLGLCTLAIVGYLRGIPAAAEWVASMMPPTIERHIGDRLLGSLDQGWLQGSEVDRGRRAAIAERFAIAAGKAAPGVAYALTFRAVGGIGGVNAFALPGGIIVLQDGLVQSADDDQVIAVLAHELGHVSAKHGTRHLLQSAGFGALTRLLWGDFAGSATSLPIALGVLAYSRDFEREADDFAVGFLRANRMSLEPLIGFLEQQEKNDATMAARVPTIASTHPSTRERIEHLRRESEH